MLALGRRLFSTGKQLVKVTLNLEGNKHQIALEKGRRLAQCLQEMHVPLDFECGFGCNCATCIVKLDEASYATMLKEQPIS